MPLGTVAFSSSVHSSLKSKSLSPSVVHLKAEKDGKSESICTQRFADRESYLTASLVRNVIVSSSLYHYEVGR